MSRLTYSLLFGFCLSIFSISSIGCGSEQNTVIEDTRSDAEIAAEEEEYEAMMDQSDADDVEE